MKLRFHNLVVALTDPARRWPPRRRKSRRLIRIRRWRNGNSGRSRQPLAQIDEQIRKTAPADYKTIEAKLLPVLKSPETPKDAKRYICRWLAVVGSADCVPAVAELLADAELSHPARMALEPGAQIRTRPHALRTALPKVKGQLLAGADRLDRRAARPKAATRSAPGGRRRPNGRQSRHGPPGRNRHRGGGSRPERCVSGRRRWPAA